MKKKWLIGGALALTMLIAIGAVAAYRKPAAAELVTVLRGTVAATTAVTGTVEAANRADLALERAGKIIATRVRVGDHINANQELVAIEASDLRAQLAQAFAARDSAHARLMQLRKGTRLEEITIAETKLSNARTELSNATTKAAGDLLNAYDKTKDTLSDAYTKAEDAVRVKTSGMFIGFSSSYRLTYTTCDSQAQIDAESLRSAADVALVAARKEITSLSATPTATEYDSVISNTRARFAVVQSFLQRTNDTLTLLCATADPSTASYRTNINTALTNIHSASTAISTLQQTIAAQKTTNQTLVTTAQSAVHNAQNELNLKRAGATAEDIAAQAATVKEAEANILNIQSQLAKTIIRAPFAGIIAKQDAKIGQIAAPNIILVGLLGDGAAQIQANVPEVTASRVQANNRVTITLDALPGETFFGRVQYIEPAETVIDGVANYKTTVVFDKPDNRIKSGFTANLKIETEKKEQVLVVPITALTENERGSFVQKDINGKLNETTVTLGIRDMNGMIEIKSGLSEGDRVATNVTENK